MQATEVPLIEISDYFELNSLIFLLFEQARYLTLFDETTRVFTVFLYGSLGLQSFNHLY
jgi:hypothetical protein